jgi:4-amino-4-deoxy-L-arabinose transferase-like glycosyltransferase
VIDAPPGERAKLWSYALLLVTGAALVRLVFAALIPLFPDETYYWDWSRHLAAGYFDHPGGLALIIRAGGVLLAPFGAADSNLGVRLGTNVAGWIAAMATIATARRIGGDGAAWRAGVVMTVMPLAAAGLILATPDAPLLAATAVGLYGVVRALECEPSTRASRRWWMFTGLMLGLAFCSKYTSIFLPVGVVIAVFARRSLRARLREPGPYVACVIATIVFLPVLVWNAHHEWISFLFQVKHGLAAPQGSALRAAWRHEGDFWGGQAALASPIVFVMLMIATGDAFKRNRGDSRFVLAVVALISFGFFVYSALRQRVEPNWPAPAYIPAIVLLATTRWSPTGMKWLKAGVAFAAVMSLLIYAQGLAPILPIAPAKDPVARAFGWRNVAASADSAAASATRIDRAPTWLGGDRYQETSELAFFTPGHPQTFSLNIAGRPNQYDLWPRFPERARRGDNLVLVLDDSDERDPHAAIEALAPYFRAAHRGALVHMKRGNGEIAERRVWTLLAWGGDWPAAR